MWKQSIIFKKDIENPSYLRLYEELRQKAKKS